ncbi:molecular chaperone DnaK [Alphaproteobacteria bacterium endosymbiont of Tiliacea citrago]|uniref:molecular chaperone DnaK n=1 Tax=Alphaproteobacteria bacterium endosymbiont of Tiliacea citrago TaxID=3077944 RepID=UPI00313B357A
MAKTVIGIDLGTTNSCVAYSENGQVKVIPNRVGSNTTPSVVAFDKDGARVVGTAAKRQPPSENILYEVKRLIGRQFKEVSNIQKNVSYKIVPSNNGDAWVEVKGKAYSPSQIGAYVLQALKEDAEAYLGHSVTEAVVTVPAYFNDSQRQAVVDAGKIAGLNVLRIINEPTAAALAYGLDKDQSKTRKIAVYDLGGGTFDVSILEISGGVFQVLSTNGDTMLGGADFDSKLVDFLLESYKKENGVDLIDNSSEAKKKESSIAFQRLKEAAEKAKIELSTALTTDISLPFLSYGESGPTHLNISVSKAKLESLCSHLIEKSLNPCKKALEDAGISKSELDDVVLVGGMTRMPKVIEEVKKFFGLDPHRGVNPDEVVAKGAAIQGAILRGDSDVKDVVLLDVTPLTLGIETMGGVMTPLIEKNTTIPTKKTQVFSTAADNQTQVQICVYQGERPMARDNKFLGEFVLDGIPNAPKGVPQIEITFDMNANGILCVTAKDKGTGKEHSIRVESSSGLTDSEIERMIKDAEMHADEDKKKAELTTTKNEAENLISSVEKGLSDHGSKLTEEDKNLIQDALNRLKETKDSDDVEAIKADIDNLQKSSMKIGEIIYNNSKNENSSDASTNDVSNSESGSNEENNN